MKGWVGLMCSVGEICSSLEMDLVAGAVCGQPCLHEM